MVKFDVKTVNNLLGIDDAFKAPGRLMEILLEREEREKLFRNFLKIDTNLEYDWFHEYFETEQAERKSKKQDFTPNSVAKLANSIVSEPVQTDYYEMAAGTGGMMIARWVYNVKEDPAFEHKRKDTMVNDVLTSSIFTYDPQAYWYHLEELSDRAIPFLLFNAAIRGINAVVIQCDSLSRKAKRAFYVKSDNKDFLAFSDILEIPKTDGFAKFLDVEWNLDGETMNDRLINVEDDLIKPLLSLLLKDKTTGENIIWATNTHPVFMTEKDILLHGEMIRPRVEKSLDEQKTRTKKKAEVFTPTWVCNRMNDNIDKSSKTKTWKEYVDSRVLEITCGEAPFLVQRYDTVTGEPIPLKDRAGLLDRKLKAIGKNTYARKEWVEWAIRAFEATYGYEYQGDNLLIARINLLLTFVDYYKDRWGEDPDKILLRLITNRIAWNVWQMDGLQGTVPLREDKCRIRDWRKHKTIVFISRKMW